jgi:hypothetical protein
VLPAGYALFFGREPKKTTAASRPEEAESGLTQPVALAAE